VPGSPGLPIVGFNYALRVGQMRCKQLSCPASSPASLVKRAIYSRPARVCRSSGPSTRSRSGGEQVPRGRRVADLPGETREPLPSGQGVRVVRAEHSGPSACRPIPSRTARPERRHMATAWHSRKSGASHGKESTASSERMLSPPYNVFDPPTAYSANAWPGDV
jgi:hypothetical protein